MYIIAADFSFICIAQLKLLDVDCISEMAKYHGLSDLAMAESVKEVCYECLYILVRTHNMCNMYTRLALVKHGHRRLTCR